MIICHFGVDNAIMVLTELLCLIGHVLIIIYTDLHMGWLLMLMKINVILRFVHMAPSLVR